MVFFLLRHRNREEKYMEIRAGPGTVFFFCKNI
nr:MAG TPA: hypothetical protein [Caudoviricetes sp.]